jgi:hypothetical protein
VLLLLLTLVPRLSELDALVTPDESDWIVVSANFYQALASGELEHTYQFVHPGVMLMWLATAAYRLTRPDLPAQMGGQAATNHDDVRNILTADGSLMVDTLVDLRMAAILFSALVVLCLFFCLIPLVGRWSAAAAIGFIVLDPMHLGFTRLLHLDGLSTNLLLVSVVAFTVYQQRGSRSMLILSGAGAGLAVLTRSANGVLAPLIGLFTLVDLAMAWHQDRTVPRAQVRRYAMALATWGAAAALAFLALWPAMWVAPIETFRSMWSGSIDLASDPHLRQVLFRGAVVSEPGWLYYPVVMAYRLSPLALIGTGLAVIAMLLPRSHRVEINRRLCVNLLLFASTYLVILSLASKKLDRYVLPSIVALDLVALLGWMAMAQLLAQRMMLPDLRVTRGVTVAVIGAVLIGQASLAAETRPYYINEATPLFGGPAGARESISFAWGKPVAEALMRIPEIQESVVVAGPWPITIDFYLPFEVEKPVYTLSLEGAAQWLEADYIVVTEPEVQRQFYPPAMLVWFDRHDPIVTVNDDGRVYARIFDVRGDRLPEPFLAGPGSGAISLGSDLQLVAADLPSVVRQGNNARLHLFFQTSGAAAVEVQIDTEIVAADGSVVGTFSTLEAITAERRAPTKTSFSVPLPADLPPDAYTVRITFRDPATGEPYAAVSSATGASLSMPVTLGSFAVAVLPDTGP